MFENSEFRRFCKNFTTKSETNFVSATRDLTPKFIKFKNSIQEVYDSPLILNNCMLLCEKLIYYEYNSKNLNTTVDLRKFHIFEQISRTQRSIV